MSIEILERDLTTPFKEEDLWLHGIVHLVKIGSFVYWKGNLVEHYCFSSEEEEKMAATKLAEDCRMLESLGIKTCTNNLFTLWRGGIHRN